MLRFNQDIWKIARGVFWIHRPQVAVMALLISVAGVSLSGASSLELVAKVGFLFWFLHCIAHPINDYVDRKSDEIGRPNAPIPAKLLTLKQAKIIIGLDYIIALILILLIPLNLLTKILAIIGLVHTYIFSAPPVHATARGVLASIVLATAFITAFISGWTAAGGLRYEPILIPLIFLIGSMEVTAKIIVDIVDVGSDAKSGRATLPMQVGVKKSFFIATFFGILTVFLFLLAYFVGQMGIFYLVIGAIGSGTILFGLFKFQKDYGRVLGREYQKIFLPPLFVFPIAMILGSI